MDQNQTPSLKNQEIIEPNQDQNQKTPEIITNLEKPVSENQGNSAIIEHSLVSNNPVQPLSVPAKTPVNPHPITDSDQKISADDETDKIDEIGKPWIKKAEEIIKKNENQPFKEEEDHEDLEIDYLKKRFGKILKKSNE